MTWHDMFIFILLWTIEYEIIGTIEASKYSAVGLLNLFAD